MSGIPSAQTADKSLLEGNYDETENSEAFQQALQSWRGGNVSKSEPNLNFDRKQSTVKTQSHSQSTTSLSNEETGTETGEIQTKTTKEIVTISLQKTGLSLTQRMLLMKLKSTNDSN